MTVSRTYVSLPLFTSEEKRLECGRGVAPPPLAPARKRGDICGQLLKMGSFHALAGVCSRWGLKQNVKGLI